MALSPYNPEMKLSDKYTLRDLTITNQPFPNMPVTEAELNNLKWLARTLEALEADFGPFKIFSAFRSPEVNAAVRGLGSTPPTKSFHEVGMAVDIQPLEMTIQEMYALILAGPWKDKLGEIALKPTQGTLHLSLPTEKYRGVAMVMDAAGTYVRQTADQIQEFIAPYVEQVSEAVEEVVYDTASDTGEKTIKTWVWVTGGIATLGILFLFIRPKKHA